MPASLGEKHNYKGYEINVKDVLGGYHADILFPDANGRKVRRGDTAKEALETAKEWIDNREE